MEESQDDARLALLERGGHEAGLKVEFTALPETTVCQARRVTVDGGVSRIR